MTTETSATAAAAPQAAPPKLHMLWPEKLFSAALSVEVPAGYRLRLFRLEDAEEYLRLMHAAGFTYWTREILDKFLLKALPDGIFVVEGPSSGLVATAMATHNPEPLHAFGGELGWVAGAPGHGGKGLGKAVTAAVIRRFIEAGYHRIYLRTDDFRLPAIKIYLQMGWEPFLYEPGMPGRWNDICKKLGIQSQETAWPSLLPPRS